MTLHSGSAATRPTAPALGWIAAALLVAIVATALVAGTVAAATPAEGAAAPVACLRAL